MILTLVEVGYFGREFYVGQTPIPSTLWSHDLEVLKTRNIEQI